MKPFYGLNTALTQSTQLKQGQGIVTATVVPAIQTSQWARNGKQPNALCESQKAESANAAAMFRTKEVFRSPGWWSGHNAGGAGDSVIYRWAFHSGPFAHALYVCPVLQPGSIGSSLSSYARIDLVPVAGGATITETFYYGQSPYSVAPASLRPVPKVVTIQPDTDYTAQLVQVDNGAIQSAVVFELASLTENNAGYLPQNFAQGSPIYAENRQNLAELVAAVWKRGGAQLLNWCYEDWVETGMQWFYRGYNTTPLKYSSATPVNILNSITEGSSTAGGSTTIGPNTPGWILDLTGKTRRAQTGVPVVLAAYGQQSAAPGVVAVRDQTGATLLSVTSFPTGAPGWVFASGTLPPTLAKYDIHLSSGTSQEFDLYAVSLYEYEA